jgi:hypothetical protein
MECSQFLVAAANVGVIGELRHGTAMFFPFSVVAVVVVAHY